MAISMKDVRTLIEKIQSLPTEQMTEVEDFVDFLKQRTPTIKTDDREPFDFPVISVGKWPDDVSLRREDLYGDDGR